MPEKFNLNQSTKPDICDARRCGEAYQHIFTNGMKLCERHLHMLTPDERKELKGAGAASKHEMDTNVKIQQYVDPVKEEAVSMAGQLADFEIADSEAAEIVGDILSDTHDKIKELENKRKEITKPLLEAKRAADALFKPAVNALEEVKVLLKGKLTDWVRTQEEARTEALESGDVAQALATPEAAAPEGTATRRVWTFEIEDFSLIPREFLALDVSKIKEEMKTKGPENVEIPGIRVFQETNVVMGK